MKSSTRRRLGRALAATALVLGLAVVLHPFYLGALARPLVERRIEDRAGSEADVGRLSVNLFSSTATLEDVVVEDADGGRLVDVESISIDFDLFEALAGRTRIDELEIEGGRIRLAVDEEGRANYRHLLERGEEDPAGEEPSEGEGDEVVVRRLVVSGIDVAWSDGRTGRRAEISGLEIDGTIDGPRDVRLESSAGSVRYASRAGGAWTHQVAPSWSLAVAGGDEGMTAIGSLRVRVLRAGALEPESLEARLDHEIEFDRTAGSLSIPSVTLDAEGVQGRLADFRIDHLDALAEGSWDRIDATAWSGRLELTVDLERLDEGLGEAVARATRGRVEGFGGKFLLVATLSGSSSRARYEESVKIFAPRISGTAGRGPYEIRLLRLDHHSDSTIDFAGRGLVAAETIEILASGSEPLLTWSNSIDGRNLFGGRGPLEVTSLETRISADLEVLGRTLADFLPADTTLGGRFENVDRISGRSGEGFRVAGRTDLVARVETVRRGRLPDLVIEGERDLTFDLDPADRLEDVEIGTFRLASRDDRAIRLELAGRLDLVQPPDSRFDVQLSSDLGDLAPYLRSLGFEDAPEGRFQERLAVRGEPGGLLVSGGGALEDVSPDIHSAVWRHDALVRVEDKTLRRMELRPRPGEPTFRLDGSGGPIATGHLEGAIEPGPEGTRFDELSLRVLAHAPGLSAWLDREGLTLEGEAEFRLVANGTMGRDMRCDVEGDLTPAAIAWRSEGEPIVDKDAGVPLRFAARCRMGHAGEEMGCRVEPLSLRVAGLELETAFLVRPGGRISGPDGSGGAVLAIPRTRLDEVAAVLPIVRTAGLGEAVVEGSLEDVAGSLSERDVRADLRLVLDSPGLDLEPIRRAMGRGGSEQDPSPDVPEPERAAAAGPPEPLDEGLRRTARRSRIDVRARIARVDLGGGRRVDDLSFEARLNLEETDGVLVARTNGRVDGERPLRVVASADLSQAHPLCELEYDAVVPYGLLPVLRLPELLTRWLPLPILARIEYPDPTRVEYRLAGSARWRGLDRPTIERSLVSPERTTISIPAGRFDLGYSLSSLGDLGGLAEGIRGELARLEERQVELRRSIEGIEDRIRSVADSAGPLRQTFERVRPLAALDPRARRELERVEGELARYDRELEALRGRRTEEQGALDRLEAEIERRRGEVAGDLGIDPFAFDFDGLTIEIEVANDDPWPGSGPLAPHSTSRVVMIRVRFDPERRDFPEFTGWADLEGRFRIQVMPPAAFLEDLDRRAPAAADILRRSGGVAWTHEGFRAMPFEDGQ